MTNARPGCSVLRSFGTLAVSSVILAGCLGTPDGAGQLLKFGAIVVKGAQTVPDQSAVSATATFFEAYAATVPNSRNQTNRCQFAPVDTSTREATGQLQAGQALTMQIGTTASSRSTSLAFEQSKMRYATPGAVSYVGGDSVTINIPGQVGGFPVAVIRTRLAEPLIVPDVTVPAAGSPMAILWNASADTTTAIYLSLKYPNPTTSTYANEQVLCALRDDGTEDIPAGGLTAFLEAPASRRSLTVTRWRTAVLNPTDKALLHIVSSVDVPVILK